MDSRVCEDRLDPFLLIRMMIMIAQNSDNRNPKKAQLLGEQHRLVGQSMVGKVSAQQQHVGHVGHAREQRVQAALGGLAEVEIGHCRDTKPFRVGHQALLTRTIQSKWGNAHATSC